MDDATPPQPESPDDPATPSDPLVGTVLARRYRIVRRLGAGAMGAVYLGEHLRFGRLDAIKVLKEGVADEPGAADRFLRGARNVSAINHPNVCTVYDFGDTDDGHQFLAMEFVDGESLSDVLEAEGRLPLRRGLELTRQIGEALDAAHHRGIVHRDLKPANVMLVTDRAGRDVVKVVDFDIAKGTADGEEAEVTRTGFVVGTPEYMSPEQLTGDPLDPRSDVYSLALLFVRMITGRLPVRASTTQNLMVERLTQDPLRISEIAADLVVPPGVQVAVDHGLQRRREDRPGSAGAFVAHLVRGARTAGGPVADEAAATPPPTPATAEGVPETRIGGTPVGASTASTPPPSLRRFAPLAIGALAVAAGGFAMVQWLGGPVDTDPVDPSAVVSEAESQGGAPSAGDETSSPPTTEGDEEAAPDAGEDASGQRDPGESDAATPTGGDPTPVGGDPTPTGGDQPPVAGTEVVTPPPLSADVARALLERQQVLLNGQTVEALDASTLAAVTDSATQMWDAVHLPDEVRAMAAFVLAQRYGLEDRTSDGLPWARRAVDLAPDTPGYQMVLERLGGHP